MTTPRERARALRFAYELMQDIRNAEALPQSLKRWASLAMRHYPTPAEVARRATTPGCADWIAPELPAPYKDISAYIGAHDTLELELDVWSAWLVSRQPHLSLKQFVAIGYAKGEQGARALFASRFGLEYAQQASVGEGVVVNGLTLQLVGSFVLDRLQAKAREREDFSAFVEVEYQ